MGYGLRVMGYGLCARKFISMKSYIDMDETKRVLSMNGRD